MRSLVGCSPNAGPQPRLEADARHERRLEGVGFRVEPVVTQPAPPPDPDVRHERIRFLGSQSCGTTLAHHCAALHGQIRWCGRSWVWAGHRSATASRTSPTQLPSYYHVGSASTAMLFPHDDAPPPTGGSSPGYHSTGNAPVTSGITSGTGILRARGDWCGTIATATSWCGGDASRLSGV